MGLKFNVDKYAIDSDNGRIEESTARKRTPQPNRVARKKVIKKNKNLTLVNRKFLRLIADK